MDTLERQQGEKFHAWAMRTKSICNFIIAFPIFPILNLIEL